MAVKVDVSRNLLYKQAVHTDDWCIDANMSKHDRQQGRQAYLTVLHSIMHDLYEHGYEDALMGEIIQHKFKMHNDCSQLLNKYSPEEYMMLKASGYALEMILDRDTDGKRDGMFTYYNTTEEFMEDYEWCIKDTYKFLKKRNESRIYMDEKSVQLLFHGPKVLKDLKKNDNDDVKLANAIPRVLMEQVFLALVPGFVLQTDVIGGGKTLVFAEKMANYETCGHPDDIFFEPV